MATLPALTPVTKPSAVTVAMEASLVDQVALALVMVAESCNVFPTSISVEAGVAISTETVGVGVELELEEDDELSELPEPVLVSLVGGVCSLVDELFPGWSHPPRVRPDIKRRERSNLLLFFIV